MATQSKFNIITRFFLTKLLRSKKTRIFILFSLVPLLIFLLVNGIKLMSGDRMMEGAAFFRNGAMPFFFQFFIQLLSLLFGAAVLSDEIDNKTLIYLNTSPVSRLSVLGGKLAAHLSVTFMVFFIGSSSLFIATRFSGALLPRNLYTLLRLEFTGLIAIIAYSCLFLLVGVSMKKSTIVGLIYIFGWEAIAQLLPGTAQKLTIVFYLHSLSPIPIPKENSILSVGISQPGYTEALITLILLSAVLFWASVTVFRRKEYLLADHT